MQEALLEFKKIGKAFGSVQANKNISFSVQKGTIHGLVGENGAGKSTLMKVLFGLYQPDEGEIHYKGKSLSHFSPIAAKKIGIGMVHQHFMLAGPVPAIDHIILDQKENQTWFRDLFFPLRRSLLLKTMEALSARFKMPVPWALKIEELPVGIQQRIEILKILNNDADLIILDEPTAVLTPQETLELFKHIRELKSHGKTIIVITHKLKEVFEIADQISVLRQGQLVFSDETKNCTIPLIAEKMVGRPVRFEASPRDEHHRNEIALEFKSFTFNSKLQNISFSVHQKEIVGIAGVEGNGQSELIQSIFLHKQLGSHFKGKLEILGKDALHLSTEEIRKMGVSYLPEDRLSQGVLVDSAATDNFLLGRHFESAFQKNGILRKKKLAAATAAGIKDFDVRPSNINLELKNFSGGNQQKLVVARELSRTPQVLIAGQPTRGVDIGAIEFIHDKLIDLRNSGGAILLISSDLDELMKLSDRILVIFNGMIQGELNRSQFDEKKIGEMMGGLK
jgi:ABC-type uncharacterized transport system ATPase subunit